MQEFTTSDGGVMTKEAGVITGLVHVRVEGNTAYIKYAGATDEYTVQGAVGQRTEQQVAKTLAANPGVDEHGNAKSVDLR